MQEARDVIERLVARGRGRLRGHDRVRRPGHDVHPAGRRGPAPGEPARLARRGRRAAVPARGRAGDAPAAREHARARPLGVPAAARGPDLRAARAGDPPGRAGAGERRRVRATSRRSRTSRCRSSGAGRWSCDGQVDAGAGRAARVRPRAARRCRPKEGLALLNGTQLMSALGALLLADADRLARTASVAAAMSRGGAPGHGGRLRRAVPARPAAPGPGRGRRRAAPPAPRLRAAGRAPRVRAQGPGPVLAALRAAGPRRRARRARPPPARAGHRAQLGHRQPARLPGRRRRCRPTPSRPAAAS